jgi:hypothetical protein
MGDGEPTADRHDGNQQGSGNDNLSSHLRPPCAQDAVQQEPEVVGIPVVEVVPMVPEIPVVEVVPVRQGVVPSVETGADVLGLRATDGGLRPPAPSSVDPNGIPIRATDDAEPIPVGDEADVAGPAKELLPVAVQVPDAVPAMPPPSKVDIPVPVDVPAIEVPVPDVAPPMPEHVVLLAVSPTGDVPDVAGLTPSDVSPVAPMGIPVGGTAEAGPMPSGDVMPSGDAPGDVPIPPTCAAAEPQLRTAATIATIKKRFIAGLSSLASELVGCC